MPLVGGLWLLAAAGLAVLLALDAGRLRAIMLHCVGQSGVLKMTPEQALAFYPLPSLHVAWQRLEWMDLAVFLAILMIFAIWTLIQTGIVRALAVAVTLVVSGLLFWHMESAFSDLCSIVDQIPVGFYIWPVLVPISLWFFICRMWQRNMAQ